MCTQLNIKKTNIKTTINYKENINYGEIINNLKKEYNNEDIIGILKIESDNFKIPIVQSDDNEYYLNHTINKEKSNKGAIFLDHRVNINTSNKLLIYGHTHSKKNYSFNILEKYYDKQYYDNNKYIKLITANKEKIYEIFSVFVEVSDFSYMNIDYKEEDFFKHIISLKNKSMYKINVKLEADDEILILQTCSTHEDYKKYKKKYLLIVSRRIF